MEIQKTIELINVIEVFRELPIETKQWLLDRCTLQPFSAGDEIFKVGEPIDEMRLIVEGKIQIRVPRKNGWKELGTFHEGTITGLLPYSRLKAVSSIGVALEPTALLSLHKKHFPVLIQEHQELTEVLVHHMTSRVREFTKSQQQNEKLMALGKLSAGLAHELNNPASAIVRSSQLLKKHLGTVPDKFKKVMEINADERQVDLVNDLLFSKLSQEPIRLSLMERTDLEDDVSEFLESKGDDEGYDHAELFVDFGFTTTDFETLHQQLNERDFPSVVGWIAQVLATEKMVDEIEKASSRIEGLVKSIKSYTHMDRSQEKELVDPMQGINDTLNILNHKIKRKGASQEVVVNDSVKPIKILPSEINQVWMNLIDNAIDALPESGGQLLINACEENDFLKVEVVDNGSGIEEENLSNIFDPFFTTKKIGEGTGLGLDVAKRVIDNHNGSLKVQSRPGQTKFEVCIPYETA